MESKHNNLRLPDAFVHLLQSDDLKYDLGSNQGKFISQNVEGIVINAGDANEPVVEYN